MGFGRPGGSMRRPGDMVGALGNASVLLALLRHADRVQIGCMTGGISTLVASDREHLWKSAGYYPFTQLMRYGQGISLRTAVDCATFEIPGYAVDDNSQYPTKEGVPFIDTAAAVNQEMGELAVFVINRNWESDNTVELDASAFEGWHFVEHIQMYADDIDAANTWENPEAVKPTVNSATVCANGKVTANLKSLSWNVFRFKK